MVPAPCPRKAVGMAPARSTVADHQCSRGAVPEACAPCGAEKPAAARFEAFPSPLAPSPPTPLPRFGGEGSKTALARSPGRAVAPIPGGNGFRTRDGPVKIAPTIDFLVPG